MISDSNDELITAYNTVKDNVKDLLKHLGYHKEHHTSEYYYKIRALDPSKLSPIEKTARFIYLNKTCFNGLYRVNAQGKFNVPIGRYKNPSIVQKEVLEEASRCLKGTRVKCMSYKQVIKYVKKGDFIYFDPPYYPLSKTSSFTSYTKDAFLDEQQEQLAKIYRKLDKKGCKVMLSNSDCKYIRELYKGYDIRVVKAKRAISCIGNRRGEINEIIVINYKPAQERLH